MQNFTGTVRRCVEDYTMINEGDTVAVGVSGGKDSVALLASLAELRAYFPKKYNLTAITVDMGFDGMDFTPIADLCDRLEVPYVIKRTQIAPIIFEHRKEKNPCALCSKMRRGALNDAITEMGITKLALGHHMDDAVETLLMSLFYEGRIACFQPVTYMSRSGVTQIRPLVYCREMDVTGYVRAKGLPIVKSTCPMDGASKRQEVKELIRTLSKDFPDIKTKVFGAMQRLPLDNWEPLKRERTKSSRD